MDLFSSVSTVFGTYSARSSWHNPVPNRETASCPERAFLHCEMRMSNLMIDRQPCPEQEKQELFAYLRANSHVQLPIQMMEAGWPLPWLSLARNPLCTQLPVISTKVL